MPPRARNDPSRDLEASVSLDMRADELARNLQELFTKLSQIDSATSSQISRRLTTHLAQDGFLNHADKQVRALLAACLAELFRIFVGTTDDEMSSQGAPVQLGPLSDVGLLKDVLEFFVEILQQCLSKNSQFYQLAYHVAQTIANTRAFLMIFNIDDHQRLIEDVIHMFFDVVSDKHTPMDRMVFLEIMVTLLGDSEVTISHSILEAILRPLTPDGKRTRHAAYTLAQDLLKKLPKGIEPSISTYFVNLMTFENTGDIRDHLTTVTYELFNISPQLVGSAMKYLEAQVMSSTAKSRLECLLLIEQLFSSAKYTEVAQADQDLLFRFASERLVDVEEKIRIQAIKVAYKYITKQSDQYTKERIKEYVNTLADRLNDGSGHVRVAAIEAICPLAISALDLLPTTVVEELGERMLDTDAHVRVAAILGCCEILRKVLYPTEGAVASVEKTRSKLGPLLPLVFSTIAQIPERSDLAYKVQTELLPLTTSESDVAKHLVYFYACADDRGVGFFDEVIEKGARARKALAEAREGAASDSVDETAKKKSQNILSVLFPNPEFRLALREIYEHTDPQLKILLGHYLELNSSFQAVNELLGLVKATPSMRRLLEEMLPFRVEKRVLKAMFKVVLEILNDMIQESNLLCHSLAVPVKPEILRQRGVRLLQVLLKHDPGVFGDTKFAEFDRLLKFWRDRDPEVSLMIHQIFAGCALEMRNLAPGAKIIEDVTERAIEFTTEVRNPPWPLEAKYDVRCLNTLAADRIRYFYDILTWAKVTLDNDDPEDPARALAACAVGEIAACTASRIKKPLEPSPSRNQSTDQFQSAVIEFFKDTVIPLFVLKNLEPAPASSTDEKTWFDRNSLSGSVMCLIYLIKAAGKFCRLYKPLLETHTKIGFPSLVGKIVNNLNKCISESTKEIGDLDAISQEHLLVTAGKQLMKIVPDYVDVLPHSMSGLVTVIPRLGKIESLNKFIRYLFKACLYKEEPGPFIAIIATASQHPDPSELGLREMIHTPLVSIMNRLRARVTKDKEKFEMHQPELGVIFLLHFFLYLKEYKEKDRITFLENYGRAIYFLIDVLATENPQFSPGILNGLLRLDKHSHVTDMPGKEIDHKLYYLCDYTLALLDKRVPQGSKHLSLGKSQIPSILSQVDDRMYVEGHEDKDKIYFSAPIQVTKRTDGTVRIYAGSHERSASRDSDGLKNGKPRTGAKRTRSSRSDSSQKDSSRHSVGDPVEE